MRGGGGWTEGRTGKMQSSKILYEHENPLEGYKQGSDMDRFIPSRRFL